MNGVFVTATDTEVGKTVICGLLARYLLDKGYNVITQKWIQTGSVDFPEDVAAHLGFMGKSKEDIEVYLADIACYVFRLAASPHLAAEAENVSIDAEKIKDSFRKLSKEFDFVIAEGIGGALVPFNRKELVIDMAAQLDLPVIIVVPNQLGAINHTLLTVEAVKARGMRILGLVFNSQGMEKEDPGVLQDNPKIIEDLTGQKIFGIQPRLDDMDMLQKVFAPIGQSILAELAGELPNG